MKRSHIAFAALVIVIILALFYLNKNSQTKPIVAKVQVSAPLSHLELPQYNNGEESIVKKGFTLVYSETYEQPVWVAYTLNLAKLIRKAKRSDSFQADRDISTGSATNKDYTHSGYDKGHMAPAADMAYSAEAMKESFLFSNISPQKPKFNRGIWKELEEETRSWCREFGEIYITTGPIFTKVLERIGPNKVAVPSKYFKTVLLYTKNQYWAIGFIIPNEGTSKPISSYMVPVDSVEKATGLNLYFNLPDDIEDEVESARRLPVWLLN
ncbi:DNA/RNA non-specific endonuclease [Williamwhitmania taraxaci]|uniref:Endonuclease G n=1 Tax=Williamwhitmania taraxaci TaxID=1640674 RepID=A0A1G6H1T0_9BACT|nr:DNA/RNA non-specific endonuclease [Williamwhitmania taraxaci]SDB88270.1 endonuclease G [Williamwhitmania taraxaci]